MAKIEFAWELGAGTGHVTTLLPLAVAMKARGHEPRFFLRDLSAGADLEGAAAIPREGAPVWIGPATVAAPLNLGEILLNFGYHDPPQHKALVDAWRERLQSSHAVVANVAPAAHLAARTLGIPSFESIPGVSRAARRSALAAAQALGARAARAPGSRGPQGAGGDERRAVGLRRQAARDDRRAVRGPAHAAHLPRARHLSRARTLGLLRHHRLGRRQGRARLAPGFGPAALRLSLFVLRRARPAARRDRRAQAARARVLPRHRPEAEGEVRGILDPLFRRRDGGLAGAPGRGHGGMPRQSPDDRAGAARGQAAAAAADAARAVPHHAAAWCASARPSASRPKSSTRTTPQRSRRSPRIATTRTRRAISSAATRGTAARPLSPPWSARIEGALARPSR